MRRAVGVVLLVLGLAFFPIADGPFGLLLAMAWSVVFLVARVEVAIQTAIRRRVLVDLAVLTLCVLGGFEGGWYLIPAGLAFAVGDLGASEAQPLSTRRRGQLAVAFRLIATSLGVTFAAIYVMVPLISAASSPAPSASSVSLFAKAPQPIAAWGLAVILVGALLVSASLGSRFLPPNRRRRVLAVGIIGLGAGAIATGAGFALFFLPLSCAVLAWQLLSAQELGVNGAAAG